MEARSGSAHRRVNTRRSILVLAARVSARWPNTCGCDRAWMRTATMVLKFSDTPQLNYGGDQGSASEIWRRMPEGSQPIATAPERTSQPIVVTEASGKSHWALHYQNAWRKVAPFKDWRSGSVSWRMDGT